MRSFLAASRELESEEPLELGGGLPWQQQARCGN